MYVTPVHTFPQLYPSNSPIRQHPVMFTHSRPHPQQSWALPSPSSSMTSIPSFVPSPPTAFHPMQPPLTAPQPSLNGNISMPQASFSGGTSSSHPSFRGGSNHTQSLFHKSVNVSQASFNNGSSIPQPSFSGGTAVFKRKSHYLEESNNDPLVSSSKTK